MNDNAASFIQRNWRYFSRLKERIRINKRNKEAAIMIQCLWRRYEAKLKVERVRF